MVDPKEIPKYIRYDFFMALFGILVAYFLFTSDRVYNIFELKILFSVISISCIIYGLFEMKSNYEREKEIRELKARLDRYRYILEINKIRK